MLYSSQHCFNSTGKDISMKYNEIWEAVDKLAKINGLTPSGLAKKAGLDPTVFNKSKRVRPDGKKRWPSLDSINKITSVCNISFEDFYHLLDETGKTEGIRGQFLVPLFNLSSFDNDNIEEKNTAYINFPDLDSDMFSVFVDKNNENCLYSKNSVLIISPQAKIKKGHKVFIALKSKKNTIIGEFINRTIDELKIFDAAKNSKTTVKIDDIEKIGRIMWVSQ